MRHTLPVIFLMLANHYPLAFATDYNWIIASLVFLMGATIRHFFNTMHSKGGMLWWTWAATAAIFALVVLLSSIPISTAEADDEAAVPAHLTHRIASAEFENVRDTVLSRCSMCHGAEVYWDGFATAPKGVLLETDAQIARNARLIYLHAGIARAMPPANITYMEPGERAMIVAWYDAVR